MKLTARLLLATLCLSLAGCETTRHEVAARVSEKFTGPTFVRRVYAGEPRLVFDQARAIIERLGFRVTKAGPTQGVLEGFSGLASDDHLRGTRQLAVKIRLTPTLDSGTEVAVLFTEIIEADFDKGAGQGTETSLRNHPLYESFFAGLSQPAVR